MGVSGPSLLVESTKSMIYPFQKSWVEHCFYHESLVLIMTIPQNTAPIHCLKTRVTDLKFVFLIVIGGERNEIAFKLKIMKSGQLIRH